MLTSGVEVHPAANLFPELTGSEFDELVADIQEHGLRDPIVLTPTRQLLDGRNRYKACQQLGDEPATRIEHSEPWAYVVSVNLHRRHLTVSQRSMVGARYAIRHRGHRWQPDSGSSDVSPDTTGDHLAPSRNEVAALFDVGPASVGRARTVYTHGVPELHDLVMNDKITVTEAARVAQHTAPEDQEVFIQAVNNGTTAKRAYGVVCFRCNKKVAKIRMTVRGTCVWCDAEDNPPPTFSIAVTPEMMANSPCMSQNSNLREEILEKIRPFDEAWEQLVVSCDEWNDDERDLIDRITTRIFEHSRDVIRSGRKRTG